MTIFLDDRQHLLQHQLEQNNRQRRLERRARVGVDSRSTQTKLTAPNAVLSDQQLLAMLCSTDKATRQSGWAAWYTRDRAKLSVYVCRRSAGQRCGDAAEDIVQESFVIAFRHISEGTYENRGRALLAYLYGIAHNLLRSLGRRQRRECSDDLYLELTPARTMPVEQQVMLEHVLDAVRESHGQLSTAQREVVDGLYGEGKASHVLGPELGKTAVNVRAIAHRSTKSIRRQLADEHDLHLTTDAVRNCLQFI